ncbi:hypothetical protein C2G38_2162489 [Gigaspora rosea]|uniref:Uncharacterized protein n=1 Tax=Gigaspora rosea TaxID=44941 RepID=A0A397VW48_9GLOM|nr:hypothetical protein C2G38_2162489 [Gigaspora rosea]
MAQFCLDVVTKMEVMLKRVKRKRLNIAKIGHADGMYHVGEFYQKGIVVERILILLLNEIREPRNRIRNNNELRCWCRRYWSAVTQNILIVVEPFGVAITRAIVTGVPLVEWSHVIKVAISGISRLVVVYRAIVSGISLVDLCWLDSSINGVGNNSWGP